MNNETKRKKQDMNFKTSGEQNTDRALETAFDFAKKRDIKTIVVASTTGKTGLKASVMGAEQNRDVVVVTHNTGFQKPGMQQMPNEMQKKIEQNGAGIHTGTLVLRGLGSAIKKQSGISEEELVAATLRLFGQGMKVCVEMAAMASDSGTIGTDDAIFVAGTGQGADTVTLISPAPSNMFFSIKVKEIVVKPLE
jgi:uncharacterized protein